ncbi:MAG TPA: molybdopterin-dependent oxidoreductase [Dehalococcoidia bacterium]|nr:molybdopterin-dependent oxidoreductase [Dehalococcoidia bacterium]
MKARDRLSQPLLRRNGAQEAVSWQEALEHTVERLAAIRQQYGPDAIAFLGSPLTTNEENYLLQKLARAIVGTNNVDSSAGPMTRAVSEALRGAFGSEILPADMTRLAGSKTLLVVADDLESSHNVAALRIKDAVVREGARLIVVSPHWGELCDFAEVWLQPRPGEEQAVLVSLLQALLITSEEVKQRVEREAGLSARLAGEVPELSEQSRRSLARARDILIDAVRDGGQQQLSFVMAMPHLGEGYAGAVTTALANLAIACLGEGAPAAFFALPQESNVWGMRDVGVDPQLLPGYRKAGDGAARTDLERSWGAVLPASQGLSFREMLARCGDGLKALVVLNDNPMFAAAEKTAVKEALSKLDFLAVIDSLHTDTAQLAEAVLSDTGIYGKEGTVTNADRRVLRLHSATAPEGEAQPAWRILGDLGQRLAARLQTAEVRINFRDPAEIMEEMAELIPLYRECRYPEMENGRQQHMEGIAAGQARLQAASAIKAGDSSGFLLSSGRTLYISYEGAAIHSAEADKIHRDEFIEINPADAKRLGIGNGTRVTLRNSRGELSLPAKLTEAVQPGMLYVPLFHDGGATAALFAEGEAYTSVDVLLAG